MFDITAVLQPTTLQEATLLLQEQPQAVVVAGGTDVLIQVRAGKLAGRPLLSLQRVQELQSDIQEDQDAIRIAPLTSFRALEKSPLIQRHIPVLAQAAGSVGGPQIRAMGTVGGNLCNGVTSADTASTLLALEASLLIAHAQGERRLALADFYLGPGRVALQPGELLRQITIPRASFLATGGCYLKYAMREAMDIATLGCVVLVRPDAAHAKIERIRLAFGVAAPVPLRTQETEQALTGLSLEQARTQIADLVRAEIKPRDSWRASRDFRLQIAGELAERALVTAWNQALAKEEA